MQLNTAYTKNRTILHGISHREPPDQDTARHHATIFQSSMNTNTVNTTTCTHNRFRHILSILDSLLLILLNTKSPDQPKPIRTKLNFYYCLNLFAMYERHFQAFRSFLFVSIEITCSISIRL